MTYNYLWLVNRLCHKLNEVPLTAANFSQAQGVYLDFQDSVNAAILDITQEEDNQWPFNWVSTSLVTTPGINLYTSPTPAVVVDWDSFYIQRPILTLTSLTQTAGLATATVSAGHQLNTGDSTIIQGSTNKAYDGTYVVTVTSVTQFTFSVPTTTVSPDTSVVTQMVSPVTTKKLLPIDYDAYREEGYLNTDGEAYGPGTYGIPDVIVRRKDNNIMMSPKPDRIYTIPFDYFTIATELTNFNDVPIIPEQFKEVIIAGAMYYVYAFRDNTEESTAAQTNFTDKLNRMRRILIPQPSFMRIDPSMQTDSPLRNSMFR